MNVEGLKATASRKRCSNIAEYKTAVCATPRTLAEEGPDTMVVRGKRHDSRVKLERHGAGATRVPTWTFHLLRWDSNRIEMSIDIRLERVLSPTQELRKDTWWRVGQKSICVIIFGSVAVNTWPRDFWSTEKKIGIRSQAR